MPRDYAHTAGNTRQTRPPRKNQGKGAGLPSWVWMFAGLSVGLSVAAFVYLSRPVAPLPAVATEAATEAPAAKPGKPVKQPPLALPPKEKSRFTFYELLPSQEVVVPREDLPAKGSKAVSAATPGEIYYIQVASYRGVDDAEKQKAALALLGAEARIEKVTIDNKDTYYRVRVGPEKDLAKAQNLMARLEDNGIQAMLVKVRN